MYNSDVLWGLWLPNLLRFKTKPRCLTSLKKNNLGKYSMYNYRVSPGHDQHDQRDTAQTAYLGGLQGPWWYTRNMKMCLVNYDYSEDHYNEDSHNDNVSNIHSYKCLPGYSRIFIGLTPLKDLPKRTNNQCADPHSATWRKGLHIVLPGWYTCNVLIPF